MKGILLVLFALTSISVHSRLFLDISMIEKKGIDIGLTLGSEIHSTEEAIEGKPIVIIMNSGIKLTLNAHFVQKNRESYGPSAYINITGKIDNELGEKVEGFFEKPVRLELGEGYSLSHRLKGERIDISLKAYLK